MDLRAVISWQRQLKNEIERVFKRGKNDTEDATGRVGKQYAVRGNK